MKRQNHTDDDSTGLEATKENIESVTGDVTGLSAVVDLMVGDETEEFANLVSQQIAFHSGWSELGYEKAIDFEMSMKDGLKTVQELPRIRLFETEKFKNARAILVYTDYSSRTEDVTRYWTVADDADAEQIISELVDEARDNYSNLDSEFYIFENTNSFGYDLNEYQTLDELEIEEYIDD